MRLLLPISVSLLLLAWQTAARSHPPMIFSTAARNSTFPTTFRRAGKSGGRPESLSGRREAEATGALLKQQQQQQSQQNQQQQNQQSQSQQQQSNSQQKQQQQNQQSSSKNSQDQQKQDEQKQSQAEQQKTEQQKQQEQQQASAPKNGRETGPKRGRRPAGQAGADDAGGGEAVAGCAEGRRTGFAMETAGQTGRPKQAGQGLVTLNLK